MLSQLKNGVLAFKTKVQNFFTKENGEVNIVAIVILIGIAVILAFIFKDFIVGFIYDLFSRSEEHLDRVYEID